MLYVLCVALSIGVCLLLPMDWSWWLVPAAVGFLALGMAGLIVGHWLGVTYPNSYQAADRAGCTTPGTNERSSCRGIDHIYRLSKLSLKPCSKLCLAAGLGVAVALCQLHHIQRSLLPQSLEAQVIPITFEIVDIPQIEPTSGADSRQKVRFKARYLVGGPDSGDQCLSLQIIRLSWYKAPVLQPGQRWSVKVKLRSPRGLLNPVGFDYQAWLHRHDVSATGYVRNRDAAPVLHQPFESMTVCHGVPTAAWLDHWRYQLAQVVDQQTLANGGLIKALLLGDKSDVTDHQWQLLLDSSTIHLMSISGLHIGLVMVLGFALSRLILLLLSRVTGWVYRPWVTVLLSTCCGVFYAALAGFSIPTVRALMMALLVQLALLLGRKLSIWWLWAVALLWVSITFPLAVTDAGYVLSFAAVGLLIVVVNGHYSSRYTPRSKLLGFIAVQWWLFIGLLLPLLWVNQSVPLLAPLANGVAIPFVSVIIVPLLLLGSALTIWWPAAWTLVLVFVDELLSWLLIGLEFLLQTPWDQFQPALSNVPWSAWLMAALGCVWLLCRALPCRYLGYVLLLPLLWPAVPKRSEFQVTVVDVGQGLSVFLQHYHGDEVSSWLYDVGPRYSARFDAGRDIVAPLLLQRGVESLEAVYVSHGDNDHAGGLIGLLGGVGAEQLWLPRIDQSRVGLQRISRLPSSHLDALELQALPNGEAGSVKPGYVQYCDADAVNSPVQAHVNSGAEALSKTSPKTLPDFIHGEWLYNNAGLRMGFVRVPDEVKRSRNDHSCVLWIEYAGRRLLLAGDIERTVERYLEFQRMPAVDVLLVPHHGSGTSSSEGWLRQLQPSLALISAGYGNRYRHPKASVLSRYHSLGINVLNTAQVGAIELQFTPDGLWQWHTAIERRGRLWHEWRRP